MSYIQFPTYVKPFFRITITERQMNKYMAVLILA